MAEVTVSELATSIGTSEERLLKQMSEAGLKQSKPSDSVSDEEKKVLLAYLKNLHGHTSDEPKKIVLKRKKIETVQGSASAGKRKVNVEVRKKRVVTKPVPVETPPPPAPEPEVEPVVEKQPTPEPEPVVEVKAVQPEVVEKVVETPVVEEPKPVVKEEPVDERSALSKAIDEAEDKRIAAMLARRKAQEEAAAAKKAALEAAKQEEQNKKDAELAKSKAASEAKQKAAAEPKKDKTAAPAKAADAGKKPSKDNNVSDRVAVTPDAAALKEVDLDDKPKKKKAGAGRAKVQKDSQSKEWFKHSHRPQDFQLHEDEESAKGFTDPNADHKLVESVAKQPKSKKPVKLVNKHVFKKPTAKIVYDVEIPETITIADLAQRLSVKAIVLVKQMMKMGEMVTINQSIDQDMAAMLVEELGHRPVLISATALEDKLVAELKQSGGDESSAESRAPIVTVMGHVDHGKTSLLDYIRKAKVASGEAGGITQHIGAYRVNTEHGQIAFLDTPGHAAFTAMRARGAMCTDVVILVVAADDGVMPQTEEAVQHARAAGVPIVVAVNKMDKEGADPDRVKNELAAKEVIPEDWGGDTPFVEVSAHTGAGIEDLLEQVSLQAELLELTAPSKGSASGVIVESRMEKGRGAVCTALVQRGSLKRGDILLAGETFGRVRAMTDETGKTSKLAGPSTPVEIIGLDGVPNAGDEFMVVKDERKAREVAQQRKDATRLERQTRQQKTNLENMFASMGDTTEKKILTIVLKADVRGSVEAIQSALLDMGNDEVGVNIVSSGVGGISESDMNLALTTGAIVLGFNVRAEAGARRLSEQESIEIRYYSIIYQLIDEVKQALSGMLDPDSREEIVGIAQVRDVFNSPKFGSIAGCMVTEGSVFRNKPIRVLRDNVVIYEGELESLRRFKDDVNEVRNGTECGIGVKDYKDVRPGDQIEVFDIVMVERSL